MYKFHDELGPEKILEVYEPVTEMHGFLIIDNTKLGIGKGGIRMSPSVSIEEVAKLARAMTLKNALASLPFGGAKAGIVADAKTISKERKRGLIEAFAFSIKEFCPSIYIAGPDIATGSEEMSWFTGALKNPKAATGKPRELGGIPHEIGSTGYGVSIAAISALRYLKKDIKKTSFAVEGFGNVGRFTAKFLSEAGAKLIAVSDSKGMVYNKAGINFKKLCEVKDKRGSIIEYPNCEVLATNKILEIDAELLVTAAIPDLIKQSNIPKLKYNIVVQGSNIPASAEAEELMHKKGILVIPDIIANAGGVISSYIEYIGGKEEDVFKLIDEKINKNIFLVLEKAKELGMTPRQAALELVMPLLRG